MSKLISSFSGGGPPTGPPLPPLSPPPPPPPVVAAAVAASLLCSSAMTESIRERVWVWHICTGVSLGGGGGDRRLDVCPDGLLPVHVGDVHPLAAPQFLEVCGEEPLAGGGVEKQVHLHHHRPRTLR
eukprot:TRINITY_DN25661_c0_g1_i1.p3 TRINITY_DN25661_c0_g1~~TRINITY_DN25661_c0_g1_i1.p3  ORF type:complete len:127 (-),score=32.56 TRINITY_DN25661_c0_g1_i1:12-392(-)